MDSRVALLIVRFHLESGGLTDANVISGNRNQEIRIIRWVTVKREGSQKKRYKKNLRG